MSNGPNFQTLAKDYARCTPGNDSERDFLAGVESAVAEIARLEKLVDRLEAASITELERLITAIDGLTLPNHTSAEDRHRDQVSRAGIKSVIGERIRELRGQPTPELSAADAFVGAGRKINAASSTDSANG